MEYASRDGRRNADSERKEYGTEDTSHDPHGNTYSFLVLKDKLRDQWIKNPFQRHLPDFLKKPK